MRVLGYTQATLDNLSGRERQPASATKSWSELTANEKEAAELLGWKNITWDDDSGMELPPMSSYKYWDQLTACGEGQCMPRTTHISDVKNEMHKLICKNYTNN